MKNIIKVVSLGSKIVWIRPFPIVMWRVDSWEKARKYNIRLAIAVTVIVAVVVALKVMNVI